MVCTVTVRSIYFYEHSRKKTLLSSFQTHVSSVMFYSTRYLISQYGLHEGSCPGTGILLVDRTNRRVLNMNQLKEATIALNLSNTNVEMVDFAGLSVEEQIRKVGLCSRSVLVRSGNKMGSFMLLKYAGVFPS